LKPPFGGPGFNGYCSVAINQNFFYLLIILDSNLFFLNSFGPEVLHDKNVFFPFFSAHLQCYQVFQRMKCQIKDEKMPKMQFFLIECQTLSKKNNARCF